VRTVQEALLVLEAMPSWLLYVVLAAGAAAENVAPPVPADAFVVAGGLLAAHGVLRPWTVFALTFVPNVTSAVGVYLVARRYGARFFKMPIARWLLREHQLEALAGFYSRWGVPAIFLGRFLPGWRAMVPVFAGVARYPALRVVPPLVLASAIWYGVLVYLGALAGRNLATLTGLLSEMGRALLWVALVILVVMAAWWWRSRHPRGET
jgi:membrane protein DedA with SNARE-associated domain